MTKIKEEIKNSSFSAWRMIFLTVLFVFAAVNIYSSQTVTPLLVGLTEYDDISVVMFLKKIRSSPFFSQELVHFQREVGEEIAREVFEDEVERDKKLKMLLELIKKNPDSRDILVEIALLYQEDGDEEGFRYYFEQAQKIDPMLRL